MNMRRCVIMHDLMSIYKMMDEGKNEEALEIVLKTIQNLNEKADEYQNWLNALGYIYCNLSEYAKVIDVYNHSIEISQKDADVENLHIGFHQKAMALRLDKQYAEALGCINKEKEIITGYFKDDYLKLSVNEYEYGYILYLMDHIEAATLHMEKCLDSALKTDDLIAQACAYRGLAEICSKVNRQKQADDYFDKAYELFIKADDSIGAEEINQIRKNTRS